MYLFKIKTNKIKVNLLSVLSVCAISFAFLTTTLVSTAFAKDLASDRVPTEDLVEGIKSRDGRWFEVEVIIFKRTDSIDLRENFSQNVESLIKPRQWDLVRDLLEPDVSMYLADLPECHQDKNPLADIDKSKFLSPQAFYKKMMDYQTLINNKWQFTNELCLMPNESLSGYWKLVNQMTDNTMHIDSKVKLAQIPQQITATDYDDLHNVYVIAEENLKLTSHFNKLKSNPHTEPMLHIGWRQPGLSKRNVRPVYLVAGKNYTSRFKYDGSEKLPPLELDMLNNLEGSELESSYQEDINNFMKKIQSGAVVDFKNNTLVYPKPTLLPSEAWELDGFIEIHLDHYLYVEGQFNFRELSKEVIDPKKFLAQLTKDKALENTKEQDQLADALSDEGIALTDESPLPDEDTLSDENAPVNENAELDNKHLITINYLKNYNFKQTRKSYSGDLHYLDHPKMGILIQVRKYRH